LKSYIIGIGSQQLWRKIAFSLRSFGEVYKCQIWHRCIGWYSELSMQLLQYIRVCAVTEGPNPIKMKRI
jgi:hypothetical protein